MISGPIPPHPRVVLKGLMQGHVTGAAGSSEPVLESGLRIIEEDLRVGDDLRVDFLARDAAGTPVLVLTVDAEDESWAPLRIVDADLWFRDNAFLLERGLGQVDSTHRPLRWSQGHRLLVVASGVSRHFYRRLEAFRSLELEVLELRSVFLRGETMWLLQSVEPWSGGDGPIALPSAPEGLEDPVLRDLAECLLERLASLSSELELRGDRFRREIRIEGRRLLCLEVPDGGLSVRISGVQEPIEIRAADDLDLVVDSLLRVMLQEGPAPIADQPIAGQQTRRGAVRVAPVRANGVRAGQLTEEEMAAFQSP